MHTISSAILEITNQFNESDLYYGHGTENAYDEAAWLVLHIIGKPLHEECDATEFVKDEHWSQIVDIAKQRVSTQKPLAYLIQSSWFCGLEFYIDERALIPRSPIAELIVDNFSPWLDLSGEEVRILDMCTGSACIAIAIAKYLPHAKVDACDISPEALEVARINVEKHNVGSQVTLYESDIFAGLPNNKYDLIVTNPPYVDKEDMDSLPSEYKHEPALALASGDDGLDFVRVFMAESKHYLKDRSGIILEVG